MANKLFFAILIAVNIAVVNLILHYLTGSSSLIGGIFLLVTSALSFYGSASVLINTVSGKTILTMGGPIWKP